VARPLLEGKRQEVFLEARLIEATILWPIPVNFVKEALASTAKRDSERLI